MTEPTACLPRSGLGARAHRCAPKTASSQRAGGCAPSPTVGQAFAVRSRAVPRGGRFAPELGPRHSHKVLRVPSASIAHGTEGLASAQLRKHLHLGVGVHPPRAPCFAAARGAGVPRRRRRWGVVVDEREPSPLRAWARKRNDPRSAARHAPPPQLGAHRCTRACGFAQIGENNTHGRRRLSNRQQRNTQRVTHRCVLES